MYDALYSSSLKPPLQKQLHNGVVRKGRSVFLSFYFLLSCGRRDAKLLLLFFLSSGLKRHNIYLLFIIILKEGNSFLFCLKRSAVLAGPDVVWHTHALDCKDHPK